MSTDLKDLLAIMPFAGLIGMELDEAGPDRVVAHLTWSPQMCTSAGILHGGALMSLADTAGGLVGVLALTQGPTTAAITSTPQMFRPLPARFLRPGAVPPPPGRAPATPHPRPHPHPR